MCCMSSQYSAQKSCMKLLSPVLCHLLSSDRASGYVMTCLLLMSQSGTRGLPQAASCTCITQHEPQCHEVLNLFWWYELQHALEELRPRLCCLLGMQKARESAMSQVKQELHSATNSSQHRLVIVDDNMYYRYRHTTSSAWQSTTIGRGCDALFETPRHT